MNINDPAVLYNKASLWLELQDFPTAIVDCWTINFYITSCHFVHECVSESDTVVLDHN